MVGLRPCAESEGIGRDLPRHHRSPRHQHPHPSPGTRPSMGLACWWPTNPDAQLTVGPRLCADVKGAEEPSTIPSPLLLTPHHTHQPSHQLQRRKGSVGRCAGHWSSYRVPLRSCCQCGGGCALHFHDSTECANWQLARRQPQEAGRSWLTKLRHVYRQGVDPSYDIWAPPLLERNDCEGTQPFLFKPLAPLTSSSSSSTWRWA